MKQSNYCETQYWHPASYILLGGVMALALLLGGAALLAGRHPVMGPAWLPVAAVLAGFLLAFGRKKITVDKDRLEISYGWLGWFGHRFKRSDIDRARVRIAVPAAGRFGFSSGRTHRCLEVVRDDRRVLVHTVHSEELHALLAPAESIDHDADRSTEGSGARRRYRVSRHWAQLQPQELSETGV